jgi:hypothetical protein
MPATENTATWLNISTPNAPRLAKPKAVASAHTASGRDTRLTRSAAGAQLVCGPVAR